MRRRALAALVVALTFLTPVTGTTATAAPTATAATTTTTATATAGKDTGRVEREPSPQEVQQQQARVAGLRGEVERQAADQANAREALEASAALAGQALEASALAVRSLQLAQQAEKQRTDQLTRAQEQVAEQRTQLGRWARSAYQRGNQVGADPTMTVLLSADRNQDVTTGLNVIKRLGEEHSANLRGVVATQRTADDAAAAAADATQVAEADAVAAANARREADTAVAQQRRLLGRADTALGRSQTQLSAAEQHQRDLEAAAAQAEAARNATRRSSNGVTGAVGDCVGGDDIEQYANGMIPVEALCPLEADPAHHLRADAAYAFDRLTNAYVRQFGKAPCITDSYRSYAAQVDVYARKPNLAARPGTSNHGWGTALDLCGGIESFTSTTHRWMTLNAPLYGWFHPAWAEPGGSKPEPWHWEYSS